MGNSHKEEHVKTKKNSNKSIYFSLAIGLFGTLLVVVGGSYAYLTDQVIANETNTISAGTVVVNFDEESTQILMEKAIPQQDEDAIANNTAYTFKVRNTGSLPINYTLKLNDVCAVGETTTSDGTVTIDKCIPLSKIKVAIKYGTEEYETKTIDFTDDTTKSIQLTTTKMLNAENSVSDLYSMKIWLNKDTGNDYSSMYPECSKTEGCNVSFRGQIELYAEQITS